MSSIPPFNRYFPTKQSMTPEQAEFYQEVKSSLKQNKYIDVEGSISYVFVYVYEILGQYLTFGFEALAKKLIFLSELYHHENVIKKWCLRWAYDCLLAMGKYKEFLEKTEPQNIFTTDRKLSNIRLNIQDHIGEMINPIDVLKTAPLRRGRIIEQNETIYRDKITFSFRKYAEENGGWIQILKKYGCYGRRHKLEFFDSALQVGKFIMDSDMGTVLTGHPKLPFAIAEFKNSEKLIHIIRELSSYAENLVRKDLGLPEIGTGWISELLLYRKIKDAFPETTIIHHGRPVWLGMQHFDIWIPNWNVAVEYNGLQHYQPVEFFGGYDSFEKQQERDNRKTDLAKMHRTKLIIVTEKTDQEEIIAEIAKHAERVKRMFNYF